MEKVKKEEKTWITEYEDPGNYSSKKTIRRYQVALGVISMIGVTLMIFFGYRAYQVNMVDPFEKEGSTLAQDYFLQGAKTYFEFDPSKLPSTPGSCTTVALKTVQEEKLMSDINYYKKCDKDMSTVKVCKLESGNYHFEVTMQCGNNQSNVAYTEEKELVKDEEIINKVEAKVYFSYQAKVLTTKNVVLGDKETMWKDEIPYKNYKIVKETTYYRYRDKLWSFEGDIRNYYPQDKANTELVKEYYVTSPDENYPFKEPTQTYAYKWYIEKDGERYYYPSGTTDKETENTYYLVAPVKDAIRDDETKTYAYKYYKVTNTEQSELLPGKPSNNAKKLENTETWSNFSPYSLHIPDTSPFGKGNREIETRVEVEVIPLMTENGEGLEWNEVTSDYISESELVNELQKLGYHVQSIHDIEGLPNIKYSINQTYKEPKEQ